MPLVPFGHAPAEARRVERPRNGPSAPQQVQALSSAATADPLGAYRALAALEYQHTIAANVRALRAAGAAALTARPERLERALLGAYQEFRRQRRI